MALSNCNRPGKCRKAHKIFGQHYCFCQSFLEAFKLIKYITPCTPSAHHHTISIYYMLVEQGQDSSNKHSQSERGRMEDTQKSLIHSNPKAFERYWLEFFGSVECSLISSQLCNLRGAPKFIFHCAIWLHSLASLPFTLPQSFWLEAVFVSFSFLLVKVWLSSLTKHGLLQSTLMVQLSKSLSMFLVYLIQLCGPVARNSVHLRLSFHINDISSFSQLQTCFF